MEVSSVSLDDVKDDELLILGYSAYGTEELDESEMEPFVKCFEGNIQGKKSCTFWIMGMGQS